MERRLGVQLQLDMRHVVQLWLKIRKHFTFVPNFMMQEMVGLRCCEHISQIDKTLSNLLSPNQTQIKAKTLFRNGETDK